MYLHEILYAKKPGRVFFASVVVITVVVLSGFLLLSLFASDGSAGATDTIKAVEVMGEEERPPALPVRLVIPRIGVDAVVQHVGVTEDGTGEMDVPSNFTDVGWYEHGVRPGMRGSAVIAGHYNGKEIPEAVFFDLHTLEIGDEVVIISADEVADTFEVVRIETYAYDDPATDVFRSTDGKRGLNLITCGGEWLPEDDQYDKRTVVFTELMTDVE